MKQVIRKAAILLQISIFVPLTPLPKAPPSKILADPIIAVPKIPAKAVPIAQTDFQPIQTVDPLPEPPTPAPTPIVQSSTDNIAGVTVSGCGDNSYANFIYMHESGCSTYNPNPSSGACGIGQAWPCSKLMQACPSMDYGCENAFFNTYALKYGGWAGAYAFWVQNQWW